MPGASADQIRIILVVVCLREQLFIREEDMLSTLKLAASFFVVDKALNFLELVRVELLFRLLVD